MLVRLDIPPGVRSADTAFARPGVWRDASLIRFYEGAPETMGGWEQVTTSQIGGVCRSIITWTDNSNRSNIAMGRHNGLSLWRAGTLVDITPATGFTVGQIDGSGGSGYGTGAYGVGGYGDPSTSDAFPLTWSFATFGETLFANPRNQGIFWWQNNTAVKPALLTNAPARCTIMTVTPSLQVMALGCTNTSGVFDPLCIRYTDTENPTGWAITSTNLAEQTFLDSGGRIVGQAWLGDTCAIWTNNSFWIGRYTGSFAQPWIFTKTADDCGLAGPNAVTVLNQVAYWITPQGRMMACGVGGIPQMLELGLGDDFASNLAPGQNDKIVASTISKFGEVIVYYADKRDGYENSRYILVNVAKGHVAPGRMARTAWCDVGAANDAYPVGITYQGDVFYQEKGTTAADQPLKAYLESSILSLDESDTVWLINSIRPDFKNQVGPITMTVSAALYPQDVPVVRTTTNFVAGQSKFDTLFSGRYLSLRLESNYYPSSFRLGTISVDLTATGTK
jgi:hypothetical protein